MINLIMFKKIWNVLKKKFYISINIQSFKNIQELMITHLDDYKNIQEYFIKILMIIQKIKLNLLFIEKFLKILTVQYLLFNLELEWKTFIIIYINSQYKQETHKFKNVVNVLLQKKLHMNEYDVSVYLIKIYNKKTQI